MPLSQLSIEVEERRRSLTVRLQPGGVHGQQGQQLRRAERTRLGSPIVQFVNGNQRTLEVELFFDTYDTPSTAEQDVRGRRTGRRSDGR